jgi:hypothetical protein
MESQKQVGYSPQSARLIIREKLLCQVPLANKVFAHQTTISAPLNGTLTKLGLYRNQIKAVTQPMPGGRTPADFQQVFLLICQDFEDERSFSELIFGDDSCFHLSERLKDSCDGKFQLVYRQHCGANSRSNHPSLDGLESTKKNHSIIDEAGF